MKLKLKIWRQKSAKDKGKMVNYDLDHVSPDMSFLEMLDVLNEQFAAKHGKPDLVITDPPRAGMHQRVVETLLALSAPKIVYVSCNPATQARDLQLLGEQYTVEKIQPVDMFPHTHHIENVVLLKKNQ